MSTSLQMIPAAEALRLQSLVSATEQGIASRVLAKASGGTPLSATPGTTVRMPADVLGVHRGKA